MRKDQKRGKQEGKQAVMITDIHRMLTGEDTEHMVFLSPVR